MKKVSYQQVILVLFYVCFLIASPVYASDESINEQGFFISGLISGYCFNDMNQNGQLDESEQKAAGVPVSLQKLFSRKEVGSVETNEDGYYEFTELGGGFYVLEATTSSEDKNTTDNPVITMIGFFQTSRNINFGIYRKPKAVLVSIRAEPLVIQEGESAVLSWTSENAETVSIDQGIGAVAASGATVVFPEETTTFTITAVGTGNTVTDSVTITVELEGSPPQDPEDTSTTTTSVSGGGGGGGGGDGGGGDDDDDDNGNGTTSTTTTGIFITGAKTYGGSDNEYANAIQQTADGGYVLAGETYSFGTGQGDFWILKLDNSTNIEWQKTCGGTSFDGAYSIQQTADRGYIVAGDTYSFGAGQADLWILKLDNSTNIEWQKTYGGSDWDEANSIQQTTDGGYVVAGSTISYGAGQGDLWILKLDPNGDIDWQNTYGGSDWDEANSIQQTTDEGYVVAGNTYSFGAGQGDFWVLKLDASGNIDWQNTYGGEGYDYATSFQQTTDGGYVVAGDTYSFDVSQGDLWLLKLDPSGNIDWQNTYGGSDNDYATSIQQAANGGYVVAGDTFSFGAGQGDAWILKLDSSGNIDWENTYGGNAFDGASSIQQIDDGDYIVAGDTFSYGAGQGDLWILKLNGAGNMPGCNIIGTSSVTVAETTVSAQETDVSDQDTEAAPINTNISPQDSFADSNNICN